MAISEGIDSIYRKIKNFRSRRHGKEFGEKFLGRYFSRYSNMDRLQLRYSLPLAIDVEAERRGLYPDAFREGVNAKIGSYDLVIENNPESVEHART